MPKLINLRQLSEASWNALLFSLQDTFANLQHPPIALFVSTYIQADEFARHWNAIQLARPDPNRKIWLRAHDPRVLHQLLRILSPRQRRRLFGRAQEFHYWVGGEWVSAIRDVGRQAGTENRSLGPSRWDWTRIERIGIVNRALYGARIAEAVALTSKGVLAEQLIERAVVRHGLIEQGDLVEFAIRGLSIAPRFDEHPEIARAISPSDAPNESSSLSDRFALIEDAVWDVLRHSTYSPAETQT